MKIYRYVKKWRGLSHHDLNVGGWGASVFIFISFINILENIIKCYTHELGSEDCIALSVCSTAFGSNLVCRWSHVTSGDLFTTFFILRIM